jgi:hypothetical protein
MYQISPHQLALCAFSLLLPMSYSATVICYQAQHVGIWKHLVSQWKTGIFQCKLIT